MPRSSAALAIPDLPPAPSPARVSPAMHPMDPRRGDNLSPMFAAFLAWLLDLEPVTDPAITAIAVTGNSVLAATSHDPLFNAHLGALEEFERNLRGWGEACCADPHMIDALVAKLRRAGR